MNRQLKITMGNMRKTFKFRSALMLALLAGGGLVLLAGEPDRPAAAPENTEKAEKVGKAFVVIFDFQCDDDAEYGKKLADRLRMRLAGADGESEVEVFEVIDRLTTREASAALGEKTDRDKLTALMDKLAANVAVVATVTKKEQDVTAAVALLDIRNKDNPLQWREVFTAHGERAGPIIVKAIVERISLKEEWAPPEYGDEAEPKNFGTPLNTGGDFDAVSEGWEAADNVSTTFVDETGRGKVLKIRTDLDRDAWLAYRRQLIMGEADPADPPKITRDTSYGSVAGLEGVHFCSGWIKAEPGKRYWLTADVKKPGGTPKIFLKGFADMDADHVDGLPESSLAELKLTPEQFAALPAEQQKKLIADDVKKHPERYRREVYRATLHCRGEKGAAGWQHYAIPIPPRGGLPENVKWLQIQCYAYWPPGEYLFDNVCLYADPNQKAGEKLPEAKPRTPGK